MNSKLVMAFAVLFSLLGGGLRPTYAAPPTDACSLLTAAQVSAALGISVKGEPASPDDKTICAWPPSSPLNKKGVLLHIVGPVGTLTPAQQFDTIKTPLPVKGITKVPVSGLGDDAVYGETRFYTELTVKKGDFVFQIKVNGFPVEEVKAKEKTLAQDVLAKL
jgi:hypothetical protein